MYYHYFHFMGRKLSGENQRRQGAAPGDDGNYGNNRLWAPSLQAIIHLPSPSLMCMKLSISEFWRTQEKQTHSQF